MCMVYQARGLRVELENLLICGGTSICSVIHDRLGKAGKLYWDSTKSHLAKYGDAGLRTLALAYRKLDEAEYTEWNAAFLRAKTTIGPNRDAMLDSASEMIEKDLTLVGATAVEDKLQPGVCCLASKLILFKLLSNVFGLSFLAWLFEQ